MPSRNNHHTNVSAGEWRTIGNEFAVRQMQGAVRAERVSHAYLFTGPDQVGKRTLAIDLARALCCPESERLGTESNPPCGSCSACDRVDRQAHPDVRMISATTPTSSDKNEKAASNRVWIGIGHINDLQSVAMLEPYESDYRVFVIDDANQMTPEAANSLLKTLEEPPLAVKLLLTAPSQSQLPATIVSRCHVISLRSVPVGTIRDALVARYGASEEEARNLAALSGGNPGWAIAALNDPSLVDSARESASRILTMLASGLDKRFDYAQDMAKEFQSDRSGVTRETTRWTQVVRDLAFVKHGMTDRVPTIHNLEQLEEISNQMSDDDIGRALNAAEETRDALSSNVLPQLAFEAMMLNTPVLAA